MPITIEMFQPHDLTDALVVVAFPSTGAAAPIAGTYLHKHLELPLVGHATSEDLAGVVHIEGGLATSPVRIHGGETQCDLEGRCPHIFTVTSEVPLPGELLPELAQAISEWAGSARLVLCLDAVAREAGDDEPDVFAAGAQPEAIRALTAAQAEALPKGLLGGLTAFLVSHGRARDVRTGVLVVEATASHPDGRAAAALIEVLDRLVPELKVDPKPLVADAMQLEQEIRKAMDAAEAAQPRRPAHTFI